MHTARPSTRWVIRILACWLLASTHTAPNLGYIAHSHDPFGNFFIVCAGRNEGIFTSFLRAEDETRGVADSKQIIPASNWHEAVDVWTVHCLKNHQKNGRVQCAKAHSTATARIALWGVKGLDYTFISRYVFALDLVPYPMSISAEMKPKMLSDCRTLVPVIWSAPTIRKHFTILSTARRNLPKITKRKRNNSR
ncbi:hypothetical protein B0H19DRAFT_131432 [Mycena capillaripes]|nr:hypothetical protein B0H19DRAFT_131432 [Mycena capillaripes]